MTDTGASGLHSVNFRSMETSIPGGLGTYTAKHIPLAVYSPVADKTFFVYGGTAEGKRHLLIMASYYDHKKRTVPKPTIVHDKEGVRDPHDNASICMDDEGRVWVFISGRGRSRPGFKYRSREPHSVDNFELVATQEMTYPQPWYVSGKGFLHLFTKYTKGRELYWETSSDGRTWAEDSKLAGFGGHYQVSQQRGGRVITAFNFHPGGNVDKRTNLYFVQTDDFGKTWKTAAGEALDVPLEALDNDALVRDYQAEGRLVYVKDIDIDGQGNPVVLHVTSKGHQPGPQNGPRVWTIAHWTGSKWEFHEVTTSDHNYDMGSLYIEPDGVWRIIAPTDPGPQPHGTGGEMVMWTSRDQGKTWQKAKVLTKNSKYNHCYARRPQNANPEFYAFWADGNPSEVSESRLYYTDKGGSNVWVLPYAMTNDYQAPQPLY